MGRCGKLEKSKSETTRCYNDLTIGCTKPSTGKGGRLIISDAMTDKGSVDGSLWIFKADQGKKPNKKVKKSKDCNREKEKECAKQENEEKMDESNSSEGILWQEDYHDYERRQL